MITNDPCPKAGLWKNPPTQIHGVPLLKKSKSPNRGIWAQRRAPQGPVGAQISLFADFSTCSNHLHISYSKAFFRFVQKSKLWARSVNKRQSYLGKTKFHPTSPNWLQSCSGSQEKSLFPFWSKFQNMSKIGQQTPEICAFKRRPAFPANCTESLTLICCNPLFFKLIHPYFHEWKRFLPIFRFSDFKGPISLVDSS